MRRKVILGIILIMLVTILLYFVIIHFQGFLDKEVSMSRAEVVKLLEKGKEYSNYYYSPDCNSEDELKTEYYIKDGVVKCVVEGEIFTWTNNNTKEYINLGIKEKEKIATIGYLDDTSTEANKESQNGFDYSLISDKEKTDINFEYMGTKIYDERETILVKVWNKDDLKVCSTIFYIDKDTGLIKKRINYTLFGLKKEVYDRNVKLDVVTDKDVEKPSLEHYKVLQ